MDFPDDVPVLSDGQVTLRAHRADDVTGVWEQCQDPTSRRWTTVPVPYSLEDAEKFVADVVPQGWREDQEWAFAVEADDEDGTPRFAGTISLAARGTRRAEIAYGSHPWARGRGVMLRATRLLLDWGFEARSLETVIWWAHKGNWASRRLAWSLGFTFAGTVPRWLEQRDELYDAWVGALQSTDPREPRGTWLDVPRIVGADVVLRAHEDRDSPRIVEACSDAQTSYWLAHMPRPYLPHHALEYVENRREAHAQGTGLFWAVTDPSTDLMLGSVGLLRLRLGEEAELGYWTHPDARGRGLTTQACALVVRHAFVPVEDGGMGLNRLTALATEDNLATRRVLEHNGFVEVGRPRQDHRLGDGSRADSVAYDLLAEEYVDRRRG